MNIAQAEFVLSNPRMPRRRLVVQHRIRALKGTEEGAKDIFDAEQKGKLLTDFYENLFSATEVQKELPKWVDLNKQFHFHELAGLPTIDGSLLRKAINSFASNKSCAKDTIVSEMLNVLDEDVLELLAEAFTKRILNTESDFIWKEPEESAYVIRYPYDPGPDKLDNHTPTRKRGLDAEESVARLVYQVATDSEALDPNLWRLESGRWTKRRRQDEIAGGGAGQVYQASATTPLETSDGSSSRSRPKRRSGNE